MKTLYSFIFALAFELFKWTTALIIAPLTLNVLLSKEVSSTCFFYCY